jgi:hypothetical protein
MSRISGDCIIVFHTLENMGFAVGIASITHAILGKVRSTSGLFQILWFYGRHLDFSADIDIVH